MLQGRSNAPLTVNLDFSIQTWAAHAPGIGTPEQWQAWAARPHVPLGDTQPDLPEMPSMSRRRLNPLGRLAAQVCYWAQQADTGMPVLLGSRYGDAVRSLALLADMARDEPVSPTAFGLSVHNAIGATYSIARADRGNYISLAAGQAGAAACLVEAAALLADGEPEVLVVCYEAPLPGDYAVFHDETPACYAWAWRVRAARHGEPRWQLSAQAEDAAAPRRADDRLPFNLDVLRFYLAGDKHLSRRVGPTRWTWTRHG